MCMRDVKEEHTHWGGRCCRMEVLCNCILLGRLLVYVLGEELLLLAVA